MNLIKTESYNIQEYKTEIECFYQNLKTLLAQTIGLNTTIPYLTNLIKENNKDITCELDLKQNKQLIDTINNNFKQIENINNIIKKQLNQWKSTFAGINGLDTKIKLLKEELLQPIKDKQITYHNSINNNGSLKEKVNTKTTLGLREYTKYRILSIDADILPREYWIVSEQSILSALKSGKEVTGVTYEIIKELK